MDLLDSDRFFFVSLKVRFVHENVPLKEGEERARERERVRDTQRDRYTKTKKDGNERTEDCETKTRKTK